MTSSPQNALPDINPALTVPSMHPMSSTPIPQAPAPDPITGMCGETAYNMRTPHVIPRKRSFHIEIESNGSTFTGNEQEVSGDNGYPAHFDNMSIRLPSIDVFPHYDLCIPVAFYRDNIFTVTRQPTSPFGKADKLMFGDTIIFNSDVSILYRVVGLYYNPEPTERECITYLAEEIKKGTSVIIHTPKSWSTEATQSRGWEITMDTGNHTTL